MGKKLLAIIVLYAVTALFYVAALIQSIHAYESLKEAQLEAYPPAVRPYVHFSSYIHIKQGAFMIVLGTLGFLGVPAVLLLFYVYLNDSDNYGESW